jgi:hypothetical protein
MLGFLRRRRRRVSGRHALGPAVTAIPSAGPAVVPPEAVPPAPVPLLAAPPVAPSRRVELGFRDGTTTELDPTSSQSIALRELAARLGEGSSSRGVLPTQPE